MVCGVVKGIGGAGLMATLFAMVADTIEYGQWKTGIRVEGTLYAATTFGAKIGAGIGGVIATTILGMAGYNGLLAEQGPAAIKAITSIYIYAPIVFLAIVPILYVVYKLDKIYPKVMADLHERENKGIK
jgi:GPH family glycoside/pentoside/hexuronide:cation symporter